MKNKKDATKLPTGFECQCGTFNKYPTYLYAHWQQEINFTCQCGRAYVIFEGVAEEL